jgi:MscS family membrane protein
MDSKLEDGSKLKGIEDFIAWWKEDAHHQFDVIWLEHMGVMFLLTGLVWGLWRLLRSKLFRLTEKTKTQWDTIILNAISAPISVFIWLMPIFYLIESIAKDSSHFQYLAFNIPHSMVFFVVVLWFLLRLVNGGEAYLMTSDKRDQTTVSGLAHVVRLAIIIIGVLTGLQQFGISLTGLLTFGGVGGLIVGLASKDLLSNFFGGLMLYLDRPFKVGDWISSPDKDIQGTVERIGLRMTMIRSFESRPIYVPNSVFSSIIVVNPSRMKNRRIYETIGLRYKDADKMRKVVARVKEMLENHPDIEPRAGIMVNFDAFADSSLNFFIYTFTKTINWSRYNDVKQDVMLKIVDIVYEEGADFAFPTRTIVLEKDETNPDAPPLILSE